MTITSTATESETYALKRDFNASTRLTAQHYLWKDTLGYLLHPRIPVPENARIADVATGNGIWLLDFARGVPASVHLDGLDISLDQCPPKAWIPKNMNLHTWDIFTEPPAELVGTFDAVHVRLITLVVRDNNPVRVITNLRKLLKPGGFLQWEEVDTLDSYVTSVDDSINTEAVDCIRRTMSTPGVSRGSDEWKRNLPTILNENGFQESELVRSEYDTTVARPWSDMYMATWEEFAKTVIKRPEETTALAAEAMDRVREGCAIMFPKLVWVAQKDPRFIEL